MSTKNYTKYTKEILEPVVASSKSYAQCLQKLGIVKAGGNYKNLQKNIFKFGLNTDHMTHQAWNKDLDVIPFENLLKPEAIKKRLIKERGHKCETCRNTEWLSEPITLELEHCDGNNRNNAKDNLKLLCPNCHSQTKTWRRRKT
jgi:hypothetical protein